MTAIKCGSEYFRVRSITFGSAADGESQGWLRKLAQKRPLKNLPASEQKKNFEVDLSRRVALCFGRWESH